MSGDEDPATSSTSEEEPHIRQDVTADRDAYATGRDHVVVNVTTGSSAGPPPQQRRVWGNVPTRNRGFTGREELLTSVREALVSSDSAVVQALHGMGGVGKTQIAIEYTHRHADTYDVIWWLNAENPVLLSEQFAALGAELGCPQPGAALRLMRQAVHNELRRCQSWLLIFDNAEDPEAISVWLPGGRGHVLITSRAQGWDEVAVPVEVDVLTRAESIEIFRKRVRSLSAEDANMVAEAVGDLPLAVAQAAGYMAETGMSAAEYTALLHDRATEILKLGRPPSYRLSLAAVAETSFEHLQAHDPATADLAAICAFLAPEPIPAEWFTKAAGQLPAELANQAADPLSWRELLSRLARSALARVEPDALVMHRLTQAILRGHLPPVQVAATKSMAHAVVITNHPGDESLPSTWPNWARALPHILSLDPAAGDHALRLLANDATRYLVQRGDAPASHDLAWHLYEQWRDQVGPDDYMTMAAANALATALRDMGRYTEAREFYEDNFARASRLHGVDHPSTLGFASDLAGDLRELGEYRAARELDEDTLARSRRVLGEDHLGTLYSANGLASDLRGLGEYRAARELDEDTLSRIRRVVGEDHPSTLLSANGLAGDLRGLGEYRAARELDEDTLARSRRVLGEDHPYVLAFANNLADDLRQTGEYRAARELAEDTLSRFRRVLGEDHPYTRTSEKNLKMVLRAIGEDSP